MDIEEAKKRVKDIREVPEILRRTLKVYGIIIALDDEVQRLQKKIHPKEGE